MSKTVDPIVPEAETIRSGDRDGGGPWAGDALAEGDSAIIVPDSESKLVAWSLEAERSSGESSAQAAAEDLGRRYRFLAKAIPLIVWTARPAGEFDSFNPRWTEYTGLTDAQGRGQGWLQVVHPDDARRCRDAWARSLAGGEGFNLDLRLRRADRTFRWHLVRALPVRDRSGRILKWLGTCTDIDDQKRAEGILGFLAEVSAALASSLDYETTLSSVAGLAVPRLADWCLVDVVEPDGSIRRIAASHADPERAEWARAVDRIAPTRLEDAPRVLRTGRAEAAFDLDEPAHSAEIDPSLVGLVRDLGIRSYLGAPLVARGRTLGAITLVMAESGRRYGPADLALAEDLALRAAMAVDNARLYSEARQAREAAEAANHAKDQFLAVLSHELRTPLTPVLATVTAALESPADTLSEDCRAAFETVRRGVELEARLIDDLLDVTRIVQGKLSLTREAVDVHDLIRRAAETCRDDARRGGLRLDLELSAVRHHSEGDPARLQQVFWNLLKNAVKFTPEGGRVAIATRDEADRLVIEVADTGIGIDPTNLDRIFLAFDQGDSAVTRTFGGLGLGLAIGRALVEAHGGTLSVRSMGKGLGSTFAVELATVPAPLAAATTPVENSPAEAAVEPLTILLVEDDDSTREVLSRLLRRQGHRVVSASGFGEAVEIGGRQAFDLVVSDLGLPDGSGFDLLHRLRGRGPVLGIALSGYGREEDRTRSREAGFAAHLTKPIDFADLIAAIRQATADGRRAPWTTREV